MKATQPKGSDRDKSNRNRFKYRGEDTVTVDRTEEEVGRTTVTGFEGDSLHPGHAVDEGGLHYLPDTEVDHAEGTYGDTIRRRLMEESPGGQIYEEEIYKLRKRSGSPRSQAIWEIEEERAMGNCLQTTCTMAAARSIIMAIGESRVRTLATILSRPTRLTAPSVPPIGSLAFGSTPMNPHRGSRCTSVPTASQLCHRLALLQIRWGFAVVPARRTARRSGPQYLDDAGVQALHTRAVHAVPTLPNRQDVRSS